MAQIIDEEGVLTFSLSRLESLGACHRSLQAKKENLLRVSRVENPWTSTVLRGMRAPGTGIPFVIMLGTMRYRGGKDFCAIYKKNPVYILEFKNEEFKRWIINANSSIPTDISEKVGA
jgi:hypothetical protein